VAGGTGVSAVGKIVALPIPGSDLVSLASGDYEATYVRHSGGVVFRTPKVRVDFRLLAHPELILSRWYRVTDYRGGRIRASLHSDIVREISAMLGRRVRHDRVPVASLEGLVVTAEVREVSSDRRQRKLVQVNRYSIIERLRGSDDL